MGQIFNLTPEAIQEKVDYETKQAEFSEQNRELFKVRKELAEVATLGRAVGRTTELGVLKGDHFVDKYGIAADFQDPITAGGYGANQDMTWKSAEEYEDFFPKEQITDSLYWMSLSPEAKAAVEPRIPDEGARIGYINEIAKRKDREVYLKNRERTLSNELQLGGAVDTASQFAASFAATMTDPGEWAVNFIPVGGWFARIPGTKTFVKRSIGRAGKGAVEGLFGAVVAEPAVLYAADADGADYDHWDSLMNLAFAPIVGGTMHLTLGTMGDAVGLNMNEKTRANRKAVEDLVGDSRVDTLDHIFNERNMAQVNTLEAIEMENRFFDDLINGKVNDAEGKPIKLNNDQRNEALTFVEQNKAAIEAGDPRLAAVGQPSKKTPDYGDPDFGPKDQYHVDNVKKINDEYSQRLQDDADLEAEMNAFAEETRRLNAGEEPRVAGEEPPAAAAIDPAEALHNRVEGHESISNRIEEEVTKHSHKLYVETADTLNQLAESGEISLNRRDVLIQEVNRLTRSRDKENALHRIIRDEVGNVWDAEDLLDKKLVNKLIARINEDTELAGIYTGKNVLDALKDLNTKTNRYISILSKRAKQPLEPVPVVNKATGKTETKMVTSPSIRAAAVNLARKEIALDGIKKHAAFADSYIKSEIKFNEANRFIDSFVENNPKATYADAYFAYMGTDYANGLVIFNAKTGLKDARISTDLRQESASADLKNGLLSELRAADLDPFVIAGEGPFHLSGTARDAIALSSAIATKTPILNIAGKPIVKGVGKVADALVGESVGRAGTRRTKVAGKKLSPRQMEEDIAQEMWNIDYKDGDFNYRDTGNTKAKEIADLFYKYLDQARRRQNDLGANIDQLKGRVVGQTHDTYRMLGAPSNSLVRTGKSFEKFLTAKKRAWKDTLLRLLDKDKTFKGADPEEWLDKAWQHIISGDAERLGAWDRNMYEPGSAENFGDAISRSRKMHFRSPKDWIEYNSTYGKTDLFGSVMNELERGGKNIGLMETHGPDPYAFHNRMKDSVRRKATATGKETEVVNISQGQENRLDNLFNEVNGSLDIPGNKLGAQFMSNARAMANMAYLPRVIFSVPADLTQWSAMQRRQGVGWMNRMVTTYLGAPFRIGEGFVRNIFTGWNKTGPVSLSEKQTAAALKLGFDFMNNQSLAKYNLVDQPGKFFQRAQDRFFKLNMLQDWDNRMKTGVVMSLSKMMDNFSGKTWGQLNKANMIPGAKNTAKFSKELQRYGINKAEWNLIRRAKEDVEGQNLITPDGVRKIKPTDDISQEFIEETANKLRMFYIDSARTAVPTPGAAQRAMGKLGTQRGTIKGEIMRSFWQFKSFMWTIMTRTWGREMAAGRIKGMSAIGGTAVAATMLGLMSNWMSAASRGERYVNKIETAINEAQNLGDYSKGAGILTEALLRGGGLGFYGDLVFADPKERARKGVTGAVGPVLQMADELAVKLPYSWLNYATGNRANKDIRAKSLRTALRYTPVLNFTQMAYAKVAFDLMVFDDMSEMLSPGYQMRMRRRALQKYGTEYWTHDVEPYGPRIDIAPKARANKKSDPKQAENYIRFKEKYGNKKIFF